MEVPTALKAPFADLKIAKAELGFYEGYSLPIALISKGIMVVLVLWALIFPIGANGTLDAWNGQLLQGFNGFYIISVGALAFFLFVLVILPSTARRKLGGPDTVPEFSNFSWFSMMFGAGLGVGLMVFATAEPPAFSKKANLATFGSENAGKCERIRSISSVMRLTQRR